MPIRSIAEQYSRFPYPPISPLALPGPNEGRRLRFERFAPVGPRDSHDGIRILVAGAGTFEALVVAQAHPRAARLIAVDLSAASLRRFRARHALYRLARPFRRLPPCETVVADLARWTPTEPFDFILASNLLQHVEDPAAMLGRLASWLKPQGLLRIVTYPKTSRLWMRETSRWLRDQGLDPLSPRLVREARRAIATLPPNHPVRSCFESQPETRTRAGLVDAFFNARENPLSPLEWRQASAKAGLSLLTEDQTETSQSRFLPELVPATAGLDAWTRLQILDDLLELCANPIFWFMKKGNAPVPSPAGNAPTAAEPAPTDEPDFQKRIHRELRRSLAHAESLLAPVGVSLDTVLDALRREVGPRVTAPPEERSLPGLSILDYDLQAIRGS